MGPCSTVVLWAGLPAGQAYSATDTLFFFSNCQAFHGESASVFAGPTRHPSQGQPAHCGYVLVYECGQQQPEQPSLQTGSQSSGHSRARMQDGQRLPSAVACPHRSFLAGDGTSRRTLTLQICLSLSDWGCCHLSGTPAAALKSVGTIRDARKLAAARPPTG